MWSLTVSLIAVSNSTIQSSTFLPQGSTAVSSSSVSLSGDTCCSMLQYSAVRCAVSAVNTIYSSKRQYFLLEYAGVLSALLQSYQLSLLLFTALGCNVGTSSTAESSATYKTCMRVSAISTVSFISVSISRALTMCVMRIVLLAAAPVSVTLSIASKHFLR
jgi:hypothetical protein